MRRLYLLTLLLVSFNFYAQPKLDSLKRTWFMVKIDSAKLNMPLATTFEDCTFSNAQRPSKGKIHEGIFYVEDYILCLKDGNRKFVFKINNGEQTYFTETIDVTFLGDGISSDQAMIFFSTLQAQEKILYKTELAKFIIDFQEYRKNLKIQKEEEPLREEVAKTLSNPLVVYDFAFTSNYSIGFRIEVINTSKKRIKYINFNVSGFNQVDDPIRTYRGEYSRVLKGVGPVEVDGSASWEFETIWSDDSFYSGKINSITVEYFDGSKRTFTKIGQMVFSDEERAIFDKYSN